MKNKLMKFFLAIAIIAAVAILHSQPKLTQSFLMLWFGGCYIAYLVLKMGAKIPKEKIYKCVFRKEVLASETGENIASLYVEGFLPFPPFTGLAVHTNNYPLTGKYDDEDPRYGNLIVGEITKVSWINGAFECNVDPYKINHNKKDLFFDSITSRYDAPWKINTWTDEAEKLLTDYVASLEKDAASLEDSGDREWHQRKLDRVNYQIGKK